MLLPAAPRTRAPEGDYEAMPPSPEGSRRARQGTVHFIAAIERLLASKSRIRGSNPGFRTENCLWQAICGRSRPIPSSLFNRVRSSSVESGTYFGHALGPRAGASDARGSLVEMPLLP